MTHHKDFKITVNMWRTSSKSLNQIQFQFLGTERKQNAFAIISVVNSLKALSKKI